MLEFLKPLKEKDFDCITFIPGKKPDTIDVEGHQYKTRGKVVGGSEMGPLYHIVLIRDHRTDPEKFDDFDEFEAILTCPLTYISGLIKGGWYGMVAKKTTSSGKFVKNAVANIKNMI
jgi:hypothetical protein